MLFMILGIVATLALFNQILKKLKKRQMPIPTSQLDQLVPLHVWRPGVPIQKYVSLGMTRHTAHTGKGLILDDANRATTCIVRGSTGSGKSRWLLFLIFQDIRRGHPLCLIDPTGSSLFYPTQQMVARTLWAYDQKIRSLPTAQAQRIQAQRDKFIKKFIFIDFSDENHGWRFNPLYVNREKGEKVSEVVGDFMKSVENMIGDMTQTRRLKNVLGACCTLLTEMGGSLLDIPAMLEIDEDDFDLFLKKLDEKAEREGFSIENDYAIYLLKTLLIPTKGRERRDLVQSTLNALGVWLSEPSVKALASCKVGNIDFDDILNNNKSLIVHAPIGQEPNIVRVAGGLIINKLQRYAYRRTTEQKKQLYTIIADEFHLLIGGDGGSFAVLSATMRQFGLRFVFAHQDSKQPPFDTPEGFNLLQSMLSNSSLKVFFQVGPDDAKEAAKFSYLPDGNRFKKPYIELSQTESLSRGWSVTNSVSRTIGKALANSHTKTTTLSNGMTVSYTEGEGVTRAHIEGLGLTVSQGQNFMQTVSESTGVSITVSDGETHITSTSAGRGRSQTTGESNSSGQTNTQGTSHSHGKSRTTGGSETQGTSRTTGGSTAVHSADTTGRSASMGGGKSSSSSKNSSFSQHEGIGSSLSFTNTASAAQTLGLPISPITETRSSGSGRSDQRNSGSGWSEGFTEGESESENWSEGVSKAHTNGRSKASNWSRSKSKSRSENWSEGESWQNGHSHSQAHSVSQTKSLSEGVSEFLSASRGISLSKTRAHGESSQFKKGVGQGTSQSIAHSKSLSESISFLESFSRSVGETMSESVGESFGTTITQSVNETEGQALGESIQVGESLSKQLVMDRFSLDEEMALEAQRIQTLPERHAIIIMPSQKKYDDLEFGESGKLNVVEIKSHPIEAEFDCSIGGIDYLEKLKEATAPIPVEPASFDDLRYELMPHTRPITGGPQTPSEPRKKRNRGKQSKKQEQPLERDSGPSEEEQRTEENTRHQPVKGFDL